MSLDTHGHPVRGVDSERASSLDQPFHSHVAPHATNSLVAWSLLRQKIEPFGSEIAKALASACSAHKIRIEYSQMPDFTPGDIDGNSIIIDVFREPDRGNRIGKVPFTVPVERLRGLPEALEEFRREKGVDRPLEVVERPWSEKLFLILHLFGHTYQWNQPNESQRTRDIRIGTQPPVSEPWYLEESRRYEQEANQYALAILQTEPVTETLRSCGLSFEEMRAWLSLEFARDWVFLETYYRTDGKTVLGGEKLMSAWGDAVERDGAPPLLDPKRYESFIAAPIEEHRQAFGG